MEKSDLRGGMVVRNTISGKTGTVRSFEGGELCYADHCVGIRTQITSGRSKGRYWCTVWNVGNLELVSES